MIKHGYHICFCEKELLNGIDRTPLESGDKLIKILEKQNKKNKISMDLIDTRALTPSITKNDFSIFGLA